MDLPETLQKTIVQAESRFADIPEDREALLKEIAEYVKQQNQEGKTAKLIFICTHNSRRSHFGQIWAQLAADINGFDVTSYSGGTEATAFNPRAVEAMRRAGFEVKKEDEGENPRYSVKFINGREPMTVWSKVYDDPANPQKDFAAVMTCSEADEACPVVLGAAARFATTYVDPKESDGTDREADTYDERCLQIGSEMLWMFSTIGK